jgi:hypothetical protein
MSRREPPPTLINVFASRIFSARLTTGNYPSLRLTLLTHLSLTCVLYQPCQPYHIIAVSRPREQVGYAPATRDASTRSTATHFCEGFAGGIAGIFYIDSVDEGISIYECTGWKLLDLGDYSRLVSPIDEVLLKVGYIFSIVENA